MDPPHDENVALYILQFCRPDYAVSEDGGHLMPTSNYQSSAPSPLSLSSTMSADLLPGGATLPEIDTDFRLEDMSSNPIGAAVNDLSPTLPNGLGYESPTEGPFRAGAQPIPHLYCPPSVSPPDYLDKVKADLDRLRSTIRNSVTKVSPSQLFEMRYLVKSNYNSLETLIQDEIDSEIHSPNSTNSANSDKERYICRLCASYKRKTYSTRGCFRRHVSTLHAPRYKFHCPLCEWVSFRRDKVHEHFRQRHPAPASLRRSDIRRVVISPPRTCPFPSCNKQVQCWEAYFDCVSEHCRLQNGSSGTSASQSRRNSDDSGSGGAGFNGHHAPGHPFGGQGPQFPNGGGGSSAGGGDFYPGLGSYYYGNSYSGGSNFAQLVGQRLSSPLGPIPHVNHISSDTGLLSSRLGKKSNETNQLRPNNLADHHQPLDSNIDMSPQSIESADDLSSYSEWRSNNPMGPPGAAASSKNSLTEVKPCQSQIHKTLPKQPAPEPHSPPPKKCKSCGHIVGSCAKCQLQKGAVERCHLCADKVSQQHEAPHDLEDYDQYYDLACNGASDRNCSVGRIAWALDQASQAFKAKDTPCWTANRCTAPAKDTPPYTSFNQTSQTVSVMTSTDRRHAIYVSEQSTISATGPENLAKTSPCVFGVRVLQSRSTTITPVLRLPQANKLECYEMLYSTLTCIGDPYAAFGPNSQKAALTPDTIPCLSKIPKGFFATQLNTPSFNSYQIETVLAKPYATGVLSLYGTKPEPATLEVRTEADSTSYHPTCEVEDVQSLQLWARPRDVASSAADQLARRRRSMLRRKLQAIIEILVLQASVANTFPDSKQLEDGSLTDPNTESEQTDVTVHKPHFLPQWLREAIGAFTTSEVDNVDSKILATSMHKAEEEIWPKVSMFVDVLMSYLESPASPTVIERQISEFRKLSLW
ncbi:putative C2H2 zinc finger domain protein [Aspergillus alliaceus]|uniref:putative C2H2 zinc finger domain protein n=1 Tax=Petromyces alliaceus TaxID=209559 RepID=UPI0012A52999|nr:uncharacterized protein BDW43DRAFT_227345 [Aspergillus alliaceus]KAB8236886.1 hypothetical protein BDW43DRAFT_227345 [Aspergillus alliaceus]